MWGLSIDIWIFQLPFKHFPFRRSTNKVFIIWIFPDIKLRCYVRLCNFHIYWEKYVLHKTLKTNVIRGKSYQLINHDLVEDVGSVDHQGEPGGATNHTAHPHHLRIIIQLFDSTILSVRNIVPNEGLERRRDHKSFRQSKEGPITKEQR